MGTSLKYETTVEVVKCLVCGKGGFTDKNPAVRYKGYTDHLQCFAKDFIKKFCESNKYFTEKDFDNLEDVMTLPKINDSWATLVHLPEGDKKIPMILNAINKKRLEEQLQALLDNYSEMEIIAILRKGKRVLYTTRKTISIIETPIPASPTDTADSPASK